MQLFYDASWQGLLCIKSQTNTAKYLPSTTESKLMTLMAMVVPWRGHPVSTNTLVTTSLRRILSNYN